MTRSATILAAAPSIRHKLRADKSKRRAFAKAVLARRKELGYASRGPFARKVGISYSQMAHIELAAHWPSLPVYRSICKVLNVGPVPLM